MKGIFKITAGLSAALACQSIFAGTMGPVVEPFNHTMTPFVSAEGFPAWIQFGGITTIRNTTVNSVEKGTFLSGGARVGAGLIYAYNPNWDLTSEFAWSYFGKTSGDMSTASISAALYGVDFLFGAAYKYRNFEIFGKLGALFERADLNVNIPSTFFISSSTADYYIASNMNNSVTGILPEVKVGLNYNVTPTIAVTAAYMHAFGSTPTLSLSSINSGSNLLIGINGTMKAPTIDAAMFGLRYKFA